MDPLLAHSALEVSGKGLQLRDGELERRETPEREQCHADALLD